MVDERYILNLIGLINTEFRIRESDDDIRLRVKLWTSELKKYPEEVVEAAVYKVIRSSEYPPRLSDICHAIDNIYSVALPSPEEIWAQMAKYLPVVAHNKAGYRYTFKEKNGKTQGENCYDENKRIYNELPYELRLYIRNLGELEELSEMSAEAIGFERARFLKRFPDIREQEKLKAILPKSVLAIVNKAAENFQIVSRMQKSIIEGKK